ncbi:MAG: glycosyltransferase [Bacteroidales bacterium]|nr:glycosyltransferase [Bacteroidales bacterium]
MNSQLPSLEVLICALGVEGLARACRIPHEPQEGVTYTISLQGAPDAVLPPQLEERQDVRLIHCPTLGLSRNRNFAIDNATGDILLTSDDDLLYHPGAFQRVREVLAEHPDAEAALFRYVRDDGGYEKAYPTGTVEVMGRLPKGYFVTSFELAHCRGTRVRYPENMGLGEEIGSGEETVAVDRLLKSGAKIILSDTVICTHQGATTGLRAGFNRGRTLGAGAAIRLIYPKTWPIRLLLKAARMHRAGQGPLLRVLRFLIKGAFAV